MSREALYRIIDQIRVTQHYNLNETIIVSGSPRTGTTWLMQLISELPDYNTLFEAFHKHWFPETKTLGYYSKPYIPLDAQNKAMSEYLYRVFTGNVHSKKPLFHRDLKSVWKRITGKKLIVKFVRASRLIPWISDNYDLRKILLIYRQPHSTIASQLKTGFNGLPWKVNPTCIIEEITNELRKIETLDEDIIKEVTKIKNDEGIMTANYCVDKMISNSVQGNNIVKISYEELFLDGENQIRKILTELGETDSINILSRKLSTPSAVTSDSSKKSITDPETQLNKWKTQLNQTQIRNIDEVLDIFKK